MKWLGLVRANLGRNKLRTALTGAAISLAVALVCMLLTMPAGLNSLLDNLTNKTIVLPYQPGPSPGFSFLIGATVGFKAKFD